MISNISLRQRLHLLLELLYSECDATMRQEIKCSMLLSLRVQICLLSSVEFLCLAWRNDAVWFLYLVLKSFSVNPRPSRQALSQRSQAKKNLQPKHHQDQLQLHEQHETNNR